MNHLHNTLKTVEHKTWIYTKRFLIGLIAAIFIFFMLLIAMSASP